MLCPRKTLTLGLLAALAVTLSQAVPVPAAREQQNEQHQPGQPQQPGQLPPQPLSQQPVPPQAPQPDDPRAVIRTQVNLVVVPVTVKDSSGDLVGDLRDDEFRILEDGVEQKIAFFSSDAFPLSAVVLLDDGLKTKTSRLVKSTLVAVAGAFGEADEVAVTRFDAYSTPVLDFTTDNAKLINTLKSVDLGNQTFSASDAGPGPQPPRPGIGDERAPGSVPATTNPFKQTNTKHIDDAIHAAAQLVRTRGRERRKVIVIVSDGANGRYNAYTHDETLKLLLSSDISVYAIGLDAAVLLRGTTDLSHYAHATGGDVYYAARESELPRFYAQVSEEARHQYTIGYLPTNTDRAKPYHTIEVRIRRPSLSVSARDGYYQVARP